MMPSLPPSTPPLDDLLTMREAAQCRAIYRLVFIVTIVLGALWMTAGSLLASDMIKKATRPPEERLRIFDFEPYDSNRYQDGIEPGIQIAIAFGGVAAIIGAAIGLSGRSAGRWVVIVAFLVMAVCQLGACGIEMMWGLRRIDRYGYMNSLGMREFLLNWIGYAVGLEIIPAIVVFAVLKTRWPNSKPRSN